MSRVDAAAPPNAFVYKRLWAVQYSAGWRRRFSGGHGGGAGAGGGEGSRPVQPLEIPHPRQVESSHIHSLHHDEHGPRPAALRRTRVAAMTRRQHARMPLLARHARTRQVWDTPAGYHPLSSLRGGKSSRGYSSSALPPTVAVHCSCLCGYGFTSFIYVVLYMCAPPDTPPSVLCSLAYMQCRPPDAAGSTHAPLTVRQPYGGRPSEGDGSHCRSRRCPCRRSAGGDREFQVADADPTQPRVALLDDVRAPLARVEEYAHL